MQKKIKNSKFSTGYTSLYIYLWFSITEKSILHPTAHERILVSLSFQIKLDNHSTLKYQAKPYIIFTISTVKCNERIYLEREREKKCIGQSNRKRINSKFLFISIII